MPTRKRPPKPAADPLAGLKIEVYCSLGETSFKAEAQLGVAAEVAARLHAELVRMGKLRPDALPTADAPAGSLYVPDDYDEGARKRLGF